MSCKVLICYCVNNLKQCFLWCGRVKVINRSFFKFFYSFFTLVYVIVQCFVSFFCSFLIFFNPFFVEKNHYLPHSFVQVTFFCYFCTLKYFVMRISFI